MYNIVLEILMVVLLGGCWIMNRTIEHKKK